MQQQLDKLESVKNLRFKPKFDKNEDDALDSEIQVLRHSIYSNLKWCEMKLKQAREQMALSEDPAQETITQNVQQAYLVKLQDAAKRLRQIERDHVERIGKLYGVEGEIQLPSSELDDEYSDHATK